MACVGNIAISTILQGCVSSQYFASNEVSGKYLRVPLTEFTVNKKGEAIERKYVLVKSEQLNFPIYVYKINGNEYSAVWMECTHQGSELSAHGEYLTCPSHGSEFDKLGQVTNGPAQSNLRKFKTSVENRFLLIHLS